MTLANQPTSPILPLENGDRLTRGEFERRYQAMPKQIKANLRGSCFVNEGRAFNSRSDHAEHGH